MQQQADNRTTIEEAILIEEETLSRLAHNLRQHKPWLDWAEDERRAFSLAMSPPDGRNGRDNRGEIDKAQNILLRLFPDEKERGAAMRVFSSLKKTVEDDRQYRRTAERVRADLPQISKNWPLADSGMVIDIQADTDNNVLPAKKQRALS